MKILAIRDKKAQMYVPQLLLFENLVQAERQFEQVVNTAGNNINRYPDDFCLVLLGEFNEIDGKFDLKSVVDVVSEARSLVANKD